MRVDGRLSGALVLALPVLCLVAVCGCSKDTDEVIGDIYDWKRNPSARNVEKIRGLLDDSDPDIRATAMNSLITLPVPDAAEIARAGIDDPNGFVRSVAAGRLGAVGDASDVESLARLLLEDSDRIVRQRAAESLAELGGEDAVAALAAALDDPMDNVRLAAVRGVRQLDPTVAIPDLARLLLEDPEWRIRVQAAGALGATGDPSVMPVLESCLADANEFVRGAAAHAIEVQRAMQERDEERLSELTTSQESSAP
jgi:HEAT repeat protein